MTRKGRFAVRIAAAVVTLLGLQAGSAQAQKHDPRHWKGWKDSQGTNFMGCVAPQACGDKSIVSVRPQARQAMSLEEFRKRQEQAGAALAAGAGASTGRLVSTSQRRVKDGTVLMARREVTDASGTLLQVVTGYVHTSKFTFSLVSSSTSARHAAANFDGAVRMLLEVLPETARTP